MVNKICNICKHNNLNDKDRCSKDVFELFDNEKCKYFDLNSLGLVIIDEPYEFQRNDCSISCTVNSLADENLNHHSLILRKNCFMLEKINYIDFYNLLFLANTSNDFWDENTPYFSEGCCCD